MGYLTLFKITYSEKTEEIRTYANQLSDGNIDNSGFYYNDEECVKWYNFERDMLQLSNQFPDVLMTVKGEGEESDDLWIQYFKGGKCTKRKYAVITIVYDEFNENNLKNDYMMNLMKI